MEHIPTKIINVQGKFDRSIKVEDLPDYIRTKGPNILYQFYALPDEQIHSCSIGGWDYLQPLNRFSNIVPYDLFIVPVPPNVDNPRGYINASFVSVRNGIRKFVATQAPMPNTLVDFWAVVWYHRCQVIVMLASCVEMSIDKCTKYWPDTSMTYGDIRVQVVSIKVTQDYNIMDLRLTYKSNQRLVRHFHYKSWPDHGIPYDTNGLVAFILLTESYVNQLKNDPALPSPSPAAAADEDVQHIGPILVHCSAGVGRTGAFIAISILKETGLETGFVNVYKCVKSLRNFRPSMVQNEEQYTLIYRIARDVLCNFTYRREAFRYMAAYDNILLPVPKMSGISPLRLFLNLQPPPPKYECGREGGSAGAEGRGETPAAEDGRPVRRYTRAFTDTTDIRAVSLSSPASDPSQSFLKLPFELCGTIIMVHQDVTAKMLRKRCEETRYKKAVATNVYRVIQYHSPATDQELEANAGDLIISDGEGEFWSKGINTRSMASSSANMTTMTPSGSKMYPTHKVVLSDVESIQPNPGTSLEFVCLYLGSMSVDYHTGTEVVLRTIDTLCAGELKKSKGSIRPKLAGLEMRWVRGQEKILIKHYIPKRSKVVREYDVPDVSFVTLHPLIPRFFSFITKESDGLACHVFFCDASAKAIVDLMGQMFQLNPST